MDPKGHEILFYLTGKASPEVIRRCDELRRDPNSTVSHVIKQLQQNSDQPIALDFGGVAALTPDGRLPAPAGRRPGWQRVAAVTACLAIATVAYYFHTSAAAAQEGKARLQAENVQLKDKNNRLQPAGRIVEEAQSVPGSPGAIQTISFVDVHSATQAAPVGAARLIVRNDTFPCRLTWKVNATQKTIDIPIGETTVSIPGGTVKITCDPRHELAWYQPFGIVHNQNYLGSTLGPALLKLNDSDMLRIQMDQPFPPWNATMIRINGEWVIVTLERPWAFKDVESYKAGQWRSDEALPNTALFWAREGSQGLGRELAKFFVEHRGGPGNAGKFRGRMHTSMIVPSIGGKVSPVFETIAEPEMATHLSQAFEFLRKQRPPIGPTIQEEIDAGGKLLKTLGLSNR